jgi:hypothetical protein
LFEVIETAGAISSPAEATPPFPFREGPDHCTCLNAIAPSHERKQIRDIWKLIGRLLDPNLPPEKSCKSYAIDGRQGQ